MIVYTPGGVLVDREVVIFDSNVTAVLYSSRSFSDDYNIAQHQ